MTHTGTRLTSGVSVAAAAEIDPATARAVELAGAIRSCSTVPRE